MLVNCATHILVIKIPFIYNTILGRPRLNALRAVVSTYHLFVWFPTRCGIEEMCGDQTMARQYFLIASKMKEPARDPLPKIFDLDLEDEDGKIQAELVEPLVTIPLERN